MNRLVPLALLTAMTMGFDAALVKGDEPLPSTSAKAKASDVQDVVLLAPNRPILVRLHVKLDGKPIQESFDAFFKHLFGLLDNDKDGKLDANERTAIPTPSTLFTTTTNYAYSRLGSALVITTPAAPKGATDPYRIEDLIDHFRKSGVTPVRVAGGSPQVNVFSGRGPGWVPNYGAGVSSDAVTNSFMRMLDTNGDGKLSMEELNRAEESLLKRDFDEDDILTIQESIGSLAQAYPYYRFASGYGNVAMTKPALGHLVFPIVSKKPSQDLAKALLKTYGPKNDAKAVTLSRVAIGLSKDSFARLDSDKNGKLDADELARFAGRKPDVEMSFDVGSKADVAQVARAERDRRIAAPVGIRIQKQQQVDLEFVNLRFSVGAPLQNGNVNYLYSAQYQKGIFPSVDRDKNGYLDEKEARNHGPYASAFKLIDADSDGKLFLKEIEAHFKKWQDLFTRAQSATVSLSLFEEGQGFFGLLDVNNDYRLSIREMRGAPGLLAKIDKDKDKCVVRGEIPLCYHVSLTKGSSQNAMYWNPQVKGGYPYVNPTTAPNPASAKAPLWFKKMDRNKDGDVSVREFIGGKTTFDQIDADSDGLLSVKEALVADTRYRSAP